MRPLTDADIDKARPPRTGYTLLKVTPEGLRCKVSKSGVKTLGYFGRSEKGDNQFKTLAHHGHGPDRAPGSMSVSAASDALHLIKQQRRELKKSGPRDAVRSAINRDATFFELFADYDAREISTRPCSEHTRNVWRNVIKTHFLGHPIDDTGKLWGQLRVADFSTPACKIAFTHHIKKLQMRKAKGGNRTGKCTLGADTNRRVRGLFEHAVLHELMTANDLPPKIKGLHKWRAINRHLSIKEIQDALAATTCEAVERTQDLPFIKDVRNVRMTEYDASFLRLLLITGGRVNSVRLARRSMRGVYNKNFLTFPAETMKQTTAQIEEPTDHHVPLTPLMLAELARLDAQPRPERADFYFPGGKKGKLGEYGARTNDWAKKITLKKKTLLGNVSPKPYTSQAMRRTMSNFMRELGVANHIIDLAAGRLPKGTDKTYITAEVLDQVFIAFQKYHAFLYACMHGRGDDWLDDVKAERLELLDKQTAERAKRLKLPPIKRAA